MKKVERALNIMNAKFVSNACDHVYIYMWIWIYIYIYHPAHTNLLPTKIQAKITGGGEERKWSFKMIHWNTEDWKGQYKL